MTTSTASVSCNGAIYIGGNEGQSVPYNHVLLVGIDFGGGPTDLWFNCADGITNYYVGAWEVPTVSDIDPVLAAGAIGAGFFVLLPLWAAVFGGRALIRAIK
jgi:hypothetical protein